MRIDRSEWCSQFRILQDSFHKEQNVKFFIHAALVVVTALASPLLAQTLYSESQISSSGQGEVQIKPTAASLYFTVQGRGETAALAATKNAQIVSETVKALIAAGLRPETISNSVYNVAPDFEFTAGARKQNGFLASNGIRIQKVNIADVGKIIDAGLAAGATMVSSAQYSGDGIEEARRSALKIAVQQARFDAEAMAAAAGGSLGRLVSLVTGAPPVPGDRMIELRAAAASSIAGGTAIRPADLTVSATATGRWEFIPRK
jgi:uncharacterized protein YggE